MANTLDDVSSIGSSIVTLILIVLFLIYAPSLFASVKKLLSDLNQSLGGDKVFQGNLQDFAMEQAAGQLPRQAATPDEIAKIKAGLPDGQVNSNAEDSGV